MVLTGPDFSGKVVAITGAAIGLGRAIALRFAGLGARVYVCDVREPELAELRAHGVVADRVDLCDRGVAREWIGGVEQLAGKALDVLVNNAGGIAGQLPQPIEQVTDESWDRVMAINLGTTFATSQAAVPAMKAQSSGSIVNISSNSAISATLTGIQAYCAGKHAVLGLTRQLAQELGPHGIRVNSVAPGLVRTNEATERQWSEYGADGQAAFLQRIAMRRLGTPEEIADVVVFLASGLAGFVNGQIISVDGGR